MGKQRAEKGDGGSGGGSAHAAERGGVAKPPRDGGDGGGARAPPARWTKEQKRAAAALPRRRAPAAAPSPRDSPEPPARRRAASPEQQHGSQYGSHFAHGESGMVNDEWQTTAEAWAELAPVLLPKFGDQCCWQPFYYDGACAKHLRHLGFRRVVHEDADFFLKVQGAPLIIIRCP